MDDENSNDTPEDAEIAHSNSEKSKRSKNSKAAEPRKDLPARGNPSNTGLKVAPVNLPKRESVMGQFLSRNQGDARRASRILDPNYFMTGLAAREDHVYNQMQSSMSLVSQMTLSTPRNNELDGTNTTFNDSYFFDSSRTLD